MEENLHPQICTRLYRKIPDNTDVISKQSSSEMNLLADHRIPVEIWYKILFRHLNPGEDLYSLYNASVLWSNILEETKLEWMFAQVFPLIIQQLCRKDVLKCREVCKRWRYGVDHLLENNVVQRPFSLKNIASNLESFQDWFTAEKLEYNFGSSQQKMDLLKHAVHHPSNPIVGKSVSIQYNQTLPQQHGQENGNCQLGIQILETFGCHIHFLRIRFNRDRPEHFLEKFVQLFESADLSNLRKLELIFWSSETDQDESTTAEQLQLYIDNLTDKQKSRLPKHLETLNITGIYGFCSSALHQILISLFSQRLRSFIKWNTKQFVFAQNILFSNLSHLALCVGSSDTLQSLLALDSPLQLLSLHFTINELDNNKLFIKFINHFQDTLTNLELQLPQADSVSVEVLEPFMIPENLTLPHLKTLKFSNYLPPSFNFIACLKSLQYLHINVYPRYINKDQFHFVDNNYPEKLDLGPSLQKFYLQTNLQHQSIKNILRHTITGHDSTLRNSYEFVEKIKDIQVEPMENMISYDVSSLFTNVPVNETINIIMDRLSNNGHWKMLAPKLDLKDIFESLCLVSENYITWRSRYFKQIKGTPMGSPLSPLIAEVFLQNMEITILPKIPYVKIWLRMVDDVFVIMRKRKENELLKLLNSYHADLKFTTEIEENGSLNFLDVTITKKEDGTLCRKVYRKPTHTDRYLDWSSHHHSSQKIGVIDSLTIRSLRICDPSSLPAELDHVLNALRRNGYPQKIIRARMDVLQTRSVKAPTNTLEEDDHWCAIPFTGPVTYQVAGILRKFLPVKFGYYTGPKLNRILTNYKDNPPKIPSGIYRIFCNCGTVYIGETKNLNNRIKDHEGDLRNQRTNRSALAEHEMINPSHKVIVDSAVLLYYENRWFARTFVEAIFIQKYPNNMNRNTGYDINAWLPLASDLIKF